MNKKRKYLLIVIAVLAVAGAAVFGGTYMKVKGEVEAVGENVFCNNIHIADVDVSGMTTEEAQKVLQEKVAEMGSEAFVVTSDEKVVEAQLKDLGLHISNLDEVLAEAISYGKEGSVWERHKAIKALEAEALHFDIEYAIEEKSVETVVTNAAPTFEVEAENATLAYEGGKFVVSEDVDGVQVDVKASVEKIMEYFGESWEFAGKETQELVTVVKAPEVTTEILSQVKDQLGSYTTTYTAGNNRAKNIAIATSRINGTLLMPGEEFSTSDTMGSRNAANGYLTAGAYLNGEVIDSYGGGVCQVSTTLYNAVLEAELEVTMRYEHSMLVDYVAPARDAAIAEGSKDFKFKNNTDSPIYIGGYTSSGSVTFVIYGAEYRAEDRVVEYQSRTLSTTEKTSKFTAAGDLSLGTVKKTSGHTGKKAELWKVVYEGGKEVSREKVNSSSYMMSPDIYKVGIASDNAEASAIVNGAVSSQDRGAIDAAIAQAKALIAQQQAPQVPETPAVPETPVEGTTEAPAVTE